MLTELQHRNGFKMNRNIIYSMFRIVQPSSMDLDTLNNYFYNIIILKFIEIIKHLLLMVLMYSVLKLMLSQLRKKTLPLLNRVFFFTMILEVGDVQKQRRLNCQVILINIRWTTKWKLQSRPLIKLSYKMNGIVMKWNVWHIWRQAKSND